MKYFKMIANNTIIGVISSDNFIRYQALNDIFLICDETTGEYISYNGKLYRSTWMQPIRLQLPFISVLTEEINKDEYDIFSAAITNNEPIIIEEEEEEEPILVEEPTIEISWMRENKINQMSKACRKAIEQGFDIEFYGKTKHFSLTIQDQLNLITLEKMAQTQSLIPYHADGEDVIFYTPEEINDIIDTANTLKMYHTTYYNSLKKYINSLETIEEISSIEYGIEIPEEYQTEVFKAIGGN